MGEFEAGRVQQPQYGDGVRGNYLVVVLVVRCRGSYKKNGSGAGLMRIGMVDGWVTEWSGARQERVAQGEVSMPRARSTVAART